MKNRYQSSLMILQFARDSALAKPWSVPAPGQSLIPDMESDNLHLYYLVMLSWLYIYRLQTKSNADVLFNLGNIFLYGSIFLFSFRYGFKESEV